MRKIKPSGWIIANKTTKQNLLDEYCDIFSNSDIEFICSFNDISSSKNNSDVTNPRILSYDIETGSGDKTGNTFPNSDLITDEVICISATVGNFQDEESVWKTYCL